MMDNSLQASCSDSLVRYSPCKVSFTAQVLIFMTVFAILRMIVRSFSFVTLIVRSWNILRSAFFTLVRHVIGINLSEMFTLIFFVLGLLGQCKNGQLCQLSVVQLVHNCVFEFLVCHVFVQLVIFFVSAISWVWNIVPSLFNRVYVFRGHHIIVFAMLVARLNTWMILRY